MLSSQPQFFVYFLIPKSHPLLTKGPSFVQAEGYTDGDLTLYHTFSVTAFLKAENPVDFLGKASEVRYLHKLD